MKPRRPYRPRLSPHVRKALAAEENRLTSTDMAALYGRWEPGEARSPLAAAVRDLIHLADDAGEMRLLLFRRFREWWGHLPPAARLARAVEMLDAVSSAADTADELGRSRWAARSLWVRALRDELAELAGRVA